MKFAGKLAAFSSALIFILGLLFFSEYTIRKLNLNPLAFNMTRDIKVEKLKTKELEDVLRLSGIPSKSYPELGNETVDYSKKFVPDILPFENQTSLRPNIKSISIAKSSKTQFELYKVNVTTDSFGRRKTPIFNSATKNLLFFGDSFTFGEGVNDNETFPFFISLRRPLFAVYNYGVPGLGLNDILHQLENLKNKNFDDVKKQKTIVVYTYMNDHLARFFCTMDCYRDGKQWLLKKPMYDQHLKFLGNFEDENSLKSKIFKGLATSKLLQFLNINFPLRFSDEQFDLFVRAVLKVRSLSSERFNVEDFYFVFYPRDTSLLYADKLIPLLEKNKIKYLIYNNIDFNELGNNIDSIPLDRHPTAMAQYLTAYLLDRDLPK